jgi:transposase-like protein
VARRGDLSVAEVAADFDISVQSVQRWKRQADIDEGIKDGLTSAEQAEEVRLRREVRRLEMENELPILRRAAAYFASASVPK